LYACTCEFSLRQESFDVILVNTVISRWGCYTNMPNSQEKRYLHATRATIHNPYDIFRNLPHLLVWENKFSCCHSEFQHRNAVNICFYTYIRYYLHHNTIVYLWPLYVPQGKCDIGINHSPLSLSHQTIVKSLISHKSIEILSPHV
jgi:hypothetical protein